MPIMMCVTIQYATGQICSYPVIQYSSLPLPVKTLGLEVKVLQYCLRQMSIQASSFFVSLDDARNAMISESVQAEETTCGKSQ